jgi:hypothetical protein
MGYRKNYARWMTVSLALLVFLWFGFGSLPGAQAQDDNPDPPDEIVKLIFIHHSCGENWLADSDGGLGLALAENNYYVSDTNYGWGPNSIGDRTDITDWSEWFRGANSGRYLGALYNESGPHSDYTRPLADPGGENQIVMFKSCFPNSDLEGRPDDPPKRGRGLSVGNAKFIYNDLLSYFSTRPDKLFVVATAPPLIDTDYAANARAFNHWLVHDWLEENNYPLSNVAVFDFHNILTHPDNHHRYQDGGVEYDDQHGDGTLYYDSHGDPHPNYEGNRKASAEFVPLLNVFYHRWQASAPPSPPVQSSPQPVPVETVLPDDQPPPPPESQPEGGGIIDDFENGPPPGTWGWDAYWDASTSTAITCASGGSPAHEGQGALYISADVASESWATCALGFDDPHDWRDFLGLSFYIHAAQAGVPFDLNVYGGSVENWETYLVTLETTPDMVDGWALVEVPWGQLLRASWEENAGAPFDPAQAVGLAFGFDGYRTPPGGEIWVDELHLMAASAPPPEAVPTQVDQPPEAAPPGP